MKDNRYAPQNTKLHPSPHSPTSLPNLSDGLDPDVIVDVHSQTLQPRFVLLS